MVPSSHTSGARHWQGWGAASCHHRPSRAMLCDRSASHRCCAWALPGPAAGCGGHGRAPGPFTFPFRAQLVEQGSLRHCTACWGELGARCQMSLAASICHRLSACLYRVWQHHRSAQGEPLGFPLAPRCRIGITLAKRPGLSPGTLQALLAAAEPGCRLPQHT